MSARRRADAPALAAGEKGGPPDPAIRVEGVSKRFGPVQALNGVSLSIGPGERVAFVGANGSGKTTLMRAVMGLLQVEGRVLVGRLDVRADPARALRGVAYIPQVAPPLDAPAGELVRAAAALRGQAPARTAALAGELGVDFARIARTRLRDLSGGTKQKLLAAMALAADAPVLVCDEPTANLDPAAREAFFGLVARRPPDAVLVLCSHRTDEVRQLVDRVVELREGQVVGDARLDDALDTRRRCRIDVRALPGPAAAAALAPLGFARLGADRWRAECPPGDKLALTARVLLHREVIVDLELHDEMAWQAAGSTQRSPEAAP